MANTAHPISAPEVFTLPYSAHIDFVSVSLLIAHMRWPETSVWCLIVIWKTSQPTWTWNDWQTSLKIVTRIFSWFTDLSQTKVCDTRFSDQSGSRDIFCMLFQKNNSFNLPYRISHFVIHTHLHIQINKKSGWQNAQKNKTRGKEGTYCILQTLTTFSWWQTIRSGR